ncbi:hypothetical protein JCM11251_005679 [Rhodosporidiobolus azoricus]
MSGEVGLPAGPLTTSTLDALLLRLDNAFYPDPTPGFVARWWLLLSITIAYIVLNILYLFLQSRYSQTGLRSFWLIRRIERPSGKFVVANSRLAWTAPILYGLYEITYLVLFYRVYVHRTSQRTWFTIRSFNAPLLFIVGWLASWSGLQGFLVAIESNDQRFLPAWAANTIFLAGGALLFLLNIGFAIATSILGSRFWYRFEDLRDAILALKASVGERAPTLVDLFPLQAPAQAFTEAQEAWQNPSTVQYSLVALLPAGCLLVNLGGLALARRLRHQIRDSFEVLAFVEARRTTNHRDIPLDDISAASKPRPSSFSTEPVDRDRVSYVDLERAVEKQKETRKPSMTTGDVKLLAKQRDERGEPVETQAHARKVLSLQKAMRDLVIIATTIGVITLAFLVDAILVAIWSSNHAIYRGHWPVTEAAISLPAWIYSFPVLVSLCYLTYNSIAIGRLTAPPASSYASGGARGKSRSTGGGGGGGTPNPFPSTSRSVSHFVDQARSASTADPGATKDAEHSDELLRPEMPPEDEAEPATPPLVERRRSSVVSVPKSTELPRQSRFSRSNWANWRGGGKRNSVVGGGAGGERPNSLVSGGIVFTVETERVCDGDTCDIWEREEKEERRRRWLEGEDEAPEVLEEEEEGRRSPLS